MKTPLSVFLFLAPALLLFAAPLCAWGDDAAARAPVVDVFYAPGMPGVIWTFLTPQGSAWFNPGDRFPTRTNFPAIPNALAACLPGRLYDVKLFFTKAGVQLAGDDFAWFNPESSLIIIRATPGKAFFARLAVENDVPLPPENINLAASVSIGTDADGKDPGAAQLRFRVTTKSWVDVTSSASGGAGVGYDCTMKAGPKRGTVSFRCSTRLKVTWEGHDYTANSDTAIPQGETQTLKLGDTPEGKAVWFHLTPSRDIESHPIDTPEKKATLIKQIEKALAASK